MVQRKWRLIWNKERLRFLESMLFSTSVRVTKYSIFAETKVDNGATERRRRKNRIGGG